MKRRWSVRAKITAMMAVPLVMLVALWLFAVSITLPSALDLRGASTIADRVGEPAEAMVTALQSERQLTGAFLASGRTSGQGVMLEARKKTDEAVAAFQRLSSSGPARSASSDELLLALDQANRALAGVAAIRSAADAGGEPDVARNGFNQIVNVTYGVFQAASTHRDAAVEQEARGVFVLSLARELLAEEDTLVGDFTTEGDYTVEDYAQIATLVGQSRLILGAGAGGAAVAVGGGEAAPGCGGGRGGGGAAVAAGRGRDRAGGGGVQLGAAHGGRVGGRGGVGAAGDERGVPEHCAAQPDAAAPAAVAAGRHGAAYE
ncbi:nitrate- and nitrite sensing domain-containing protein [Dactylosporangium sp. CA-139066]|uniref:nitrate- and nitrite sensing domain-containing protein n=1 Tax=Dactylosporangium sp. CA-139066 TaxID=3239930 RepID=UPI003D9450EB